MIDDAINPIDTIIEIPDDENVTKMDGQTDIKIEEQNGIYKSDNEDEDKWDNNFQKCWAGYKQVGMKDKGGKMVPNCVPVEKADKPEDMQKTIWGGHFSPDLKK